MNMTLALRRLGILAAAALLATAVGMKPLHVYAMGTDNPPPPTDDGKKKKKKNNAVEQQQQQQADAKFLRDYRAAREIILAGNYQGGIAAMHALGHDEHADVANYIGYAYRKLGDYKDFASLVRGRAESRPQPCAHLVVLRHVADGTGQPAQGARRSAEGQPDLRQYLVRGIPPAQGRDRRQGQLLMASY